MIRLFGKIFSAPAVSTVGADFVSDTAAPSAHLVAQLEALNRSPYLQLADSGLGILSVFDDLKYDRADADLMSPAMRRFAVTQVQPLGFRQVSGSVLEQDGSGARIVIPKLHSLGASPFDITRYTPKRAADFYLLTPTQTVCRYIDCYPLEEALDRALGLVRKHPINLYRLMDYLERKPTHSAFRSVLGDIKKAQREAGESEPLCRRKALG